mmetsp:Transcript_45076/g.77976  ORF Transcript_45076/g.77976 Transcript_45076/m.77976 type:complete len:116 (-) Transcript_45076:206-553(-)
MWMKRRSGSSMYEMSPLVDWMTTKNGFVLLGEVVPKKARVFQKKQGTPQIHQRVTHHHRHQQDVCSSIRLENAAFTLFGPFSAGPTHFGQVFWKTGRHGKVKQSSQIMSYREIST